MSDIQSRLLSELLAGSVKSMSNSEIVKQFVDAMMQGDVESLTKHMSPNIVWHPPTSVADQFHAKVEGPEAVLSFLTENPEKFYEPGSRYAEVLHVVSENDLVSIHFNFHATPKIGGKLCTCSNWMFQLKDGKIVEVWEVLDVAEWKNAVLPPHIVPDSAYQNG